MTLRVAIVGCGKSSENHISEIRKLPCAQLVGVCDSEPLMAEQFSIRHGLKRLVFWTSDACCSSSIPMSSTLLLRPQSHLEVALRAIEAGCHLFVEKPLTENARQASQLVRTARANGCRLTVGWTHYFDPAARAARKRIAQGVIGSVVHVEASFTAYDLGSDFGAAVLQDCTHWVQNRFLPGNAPVSEQSGSHPRRKLAEYVEPENCVLEVRAMACQCLIPPIRICSMSFASR